MEMLTKKSVNLVFRFEKTELIAKESERGKGSRRSSLLGNITKGE